MTPIDYKAARSGWPAQKRALARAQKATGEGEPRASVERACVEAVHEWRKWGAWPDDWSLFQIALDDVRGWREQVGLEEFVSGVDREVRDQAQRRAEAEKARVDALYPEHAKLTALGGDNQTVGAFIEWLGERGYAICEWADRQDEDDEHGYSPAGWYPLGRSISSWIAEYFGINPVRLEQEKRAMLDGMRAANAKAEVGG